VLYFRVDRALKEDVEAFAARRRAEMPGVSYSTADAVRELLWSELERRGLRPT
jgi:hypothetical protein